MYLSVMTLLALALVSVLLLFSAMKLVFTKSSSKKWRKFGCLSRLWVLVPLINFFTSRDIAEEGVTGVTIVFLPLLVETFVLLIRAVSCLLLERGNTIYELFSEWLRKLYIVRLVRNIAMFIRSICRWIVDKVVDLKQLMLQGFPQGVHAESLLPANSDSSSKC